jgi:condensin complex subunit 1
VDVFDVYRSLLRHSHLLPPSILSKLLDSLVSGLQVEIDGVNRDMEAGSLLQGIQQDDDDAEDHRQAYLMHKQPLEMYAFLMLWLVQASEKVASKSAGGEGGDQMVAAGRGKVSGRPSCRWVRSTWLRGVKIGKHRSH